MKVIYKVVDNPNKYNNSYRKKSIVFFVIKFMNTHTV